MTYLQSISIPRQMKQSLTKDQDGISISNFGSQGPYQDGPSRYLTGLLLRRVAKDFSIGESPNLCSTFFNNFLKFKGQYPAKIFALSDGFTQPIGYD